MFKRIAGFVSRALHGRHAPSTPPAVPAGTLPATTQPAGPRPVLVGLSGEFAGAELELDERDVALGTDPRQCQLVFPADHELVCKRHCTLRWDAPAQQLLLEDCWSANGTFVGAGRALEAGQPWQLAAGECFYLGQPSVMFVVRFE